MTAREQQLLLAGCRGFRFLTSIKGVVLGTEAGEVPLGHIFQARFWHCNTPESLITQVG